MPFSLNWLWFDSRPGILVLINDTDWELEGDLDYEIQNGDNIMFISSEFAVIVLLALKILRYASTVHFAYDISCLFSRRSTTWWLNSNLRREETYKASLSAILQARGNELQIPEQSPEARKDTVSFLSS